MNISLINHSKIPFIVNRIFQTFFGGFELKSNADSTFKSIQNASIVRILAYLFPTTLGIFSSLMINFGYIDRFVGVLITAIIELFFMLIMNTMPQISSAGYNKTSPLWSPNLMIRKPQRLFPIIVKYHSMMFMLVRSLVSASLLGMMTNAFHLKQIKIYFKCDSLLAMVIFVLVWFTFTTAHFSLIVGTPPETAAYSISFHPLECFNRAFYLLIMLIPSTLFTTGTASIIMETYPLFTVIICCLPFLWLFGTLPPIPALCHYLLERINVVLLGGTGNCYVLPLIGTLIFSFVAICMSHFYLDQNQFFLINTMVAFMISHKWLFNLDQWRRWTCYATTIGSIIAIVILNSIQIPQIQMDHVLLSLSALILSIIYLVHYFKQVYLFNIVKNPLYLILSPKFLERFHSNRIFISMIRILLHFCLPVIILTMILNELNTEEIFARIHTLNLGDFFLNILVFRTFRKCWQHPQAIGLQMIFLQTLERQWPDSWTGGWSLETKLFTIDLSINFWKNFTGKLYMLLTILFSSVMLRKQKIKYSWILFAFNVIWMPMNLVMIILSSIFNAPILPLFTLPIFFVSFPRPLKYWSTTPIIPSTIWINQTDAIYYKQLMPRLIISLLNKSLFWDFRTTGEILLARFDDRLMWMQILESGHNYSQVQMKGLELQETSCHTIEASVIDQMIEHSFHHSLNDFIGKFFNKHLFHSINPLMKITTKTYTDAKSVLTGIIDSPETIIKIKQVFGRVFVWLLLKQKLNSVMETRNIKLNSKSLVSKESQINILVHSENMDSDRTFALDHEQKQFSFGDLRIDPQWLSTIHQYSRRKSLQPNVIQMNHHSMFPPEWFRKVLKVTTNNQDKLDENELQSLILDYNQIINVCYAIVFANKHADTSLAQNIYELYNGLLIKDSLDGKFFALYPDLYHVCTKCFQYATKIAFDQIIFDEKNLKDKELIHILEDFDQNWYFGPCKTITWNRAVIEEKSHLFCISKDLVKENYQSNLLTLKDTDVYLFQMNRDVVEAIWSSLSLELIYLTNDDEERFSIQAHPWIFRNLTVQAADIPLGYPVFLSEPVVINYF